MLQMKKIKYIARNGRKTDTTKPILKKKTLLTFKTQPF